MNDFRSFQQALPIALDFLATSGWALLVSFPLVIVIAGRSYLAAQRRKAEFRKYRATLDSLKDELEQIKLQIASKGSAATALPLEAARTDARPGPSTRG